jgi:hypothetical protein
MVIDLTGGKLTMTAKTELIALLAGRNRGILAPEPDKRVILAAIARLEQENPTPYPLKEADRLGGVWRLLFTTSQELLRIDLLPFFKLGQIYQCISMEAQRVYNIAELTGVPYLDGIVSVSAGFQPVSDTRVDVMFERLVLGLQRWLGYESPEQFIHRLDTTSQFLGVDVKLPNRERQGWLEVTYLDDDLRVGRGNQGSVFVLTKAVTSPVSGEVRSE